MQGPSLPLAPAPALVRILAAWICVPGAAAQDSRVPLPVDPDGRLPAPLRESLGRLDPGSDGWESEAFQSRAGGQLRALGEVILTHGGAGGGEGALEALTTEDVGATPLAPEAVEVFRDGLFQVRRAPAADGDTPLGVGRAALAENLAGLTALFAGCRSHHSHFKIIGVEREGELWRTAVRLELDGRGADGAVQVTARWSCEWRLSPEGVPLLARIRARELEQVRGPPRPLFADVTEAVLGSQALAQLGPPLAHWRGRLDASLGVGTLGHHGMALGDVNGDGLEDLYVCQPGGLPNRLFLHRADGTTQEVSARAGVDFLGYGTGALLVDLDRDVDLDLVVVVGNRLLFLENDGGTGRFAPRSVVQAAGLTMLTAADVNGDGFLDVFACGYLSPYDGLATPVPYHDANNGQRNVLLVNDGQWGFVDRTAELGLDVNNRRFSFAAAWEDYDDDGDLDLYVANDFGRNNLYRNDGGHFVDVAAELGVEDISAGMGVSWADVDGDGLLDLHVANMFSSAGNRVTYQRRFRDGADTDVAAFRRHARGNSLFLNRGPQGFVDASLPAGITVGRWAWGAIFCDLNNDARPDLFVPNGFVTNERSDDL